MDKDTEKYLIGWLRRGTSKWPGRRQCLSKAKTMVVIGGQVRARFKCAACGNQFDKRHVEVDHKNEVGPFKGDWNDFLERMYCDVGNLQVLCVNCHSKKTSTYNARLRWSRNEDLSWL